MTSRTTECLVLYYVMSALRPTDQWFERDVLRRFKMAFIGTFFDGFLDDLVAHSK